MSDLDTKMFNIAEKVVRDALYCSDMDEAQYIDWDLVVIAHEAILDLVRKGLTSGGDA